MASEHNIRTAPAYRRPMRTMEVRHFVAYAGLAIALIAGITLRFAYSADIEWKGDERWTFDHALAMAAGDAWNATGMPASVGGTNPGMSLWVFGALAKIFQVQSPPELARAVQCLNSAALIALVAFAFALVPRERRATWLWAAALWALNPLAIVFERKIWPPSTLPLLTVALIAAWSMRHNIIASFIWGALGALMAQIHLGVFFLVIALVGWTALQNRKSVRFGSWIAGSLAGTLPAIPWLMETARSGGTAMQGLRIPIFSFFVRWVQQPFGLGSEYTLGSMDMIEFLADPVIGGVPTYLVAVAHVAIAGIVVAVFVAAMRRAIWLRLSWREAFIGRSPEAVLINASLWGYGLLMTMLTSFGAGAYRHYMIVIAPVMALWAARIVIYAAAPRERLAAILLVTICLAQAVISASLLRYIDRVQVIRGEYGATWQSQERSPVR